MATFTNDAHARKRSQVIQVVINPLHVNKHIVVDQLFRVSRIVHKNHVTRIGGNEQMTISVSRTLVQTPTYAGRSRASHVFLRFGKEEFAEVNHRHHFRTLISRHILIRLNLHDARATEHEDGLGVGIVGTTVGTFKGVDQDFRSNRRNDRFTNFPTNSRLVFASHRGPGRIGKPTEIGIRRARLTLFRRTGRIATARFASTTRIIGIGKVSVSIAIPNHGRQLVILTAVRRFRTKGHLVTVRRKVAHSRVCFG